MSHYSKQLTGLALAWGGLLWIALYGVVIIIGMETGKLVTSLDPAHSPIIAHIGVWILPVSILLLGVGQLGVFAKLEKRARGLGVTSLVLTSLGVIMALVDLISLSGINSNLANLSGMTGGLGAMSTTVGAAFLGWAVLRTHVLPRWMAWTFIIIGVVTIPVLFATPLPFGPDWASDFLAFLLSGIAYTILGFRLLIIHKPDAENARSMATQVATQVK